MITKNMVVKGYGKGLIKLINSPNGDGIVCSIGDNWFYFGGETASTQKASSLQRRSSRRSLSFLKRKEQQLKQNASQRQLRTKRSSLLKS